MFSESDLTHSDLLRGHYQYVGRSLKVNGSFCRDTYILIERLGNCPSHTQYHTSCIDNILYTNQQIF
ncbi:TPA: hypothetical protein MHW08_06155 [Klebsiella pneumoniae]|nr:hypothetical protein [Klebsiella pneumoniae]QBL48689.1 hypothetical protein BMD99_009050 [Klebsiella sp. PO552]EIW8766418.1 hypothetical protein [Klebsiella pneumoniae]HBX3147052.1 hypothetical protein [Klebsiella pneumoniae]HBX8616829.1 hypothetical protein [Klebsiella pneumoniae]